MKQTVALTAGLALFCLGVLAGLFMRRAPSDPISPAASRGQLSTSPPERTPQADPSVAKLEARVRELEVEVQKARVVAPKSAHEGIPASAAEEIFKAYLELNKAKNPDPEKARSLFTRLGQLDDKSAGYFIEQFQKSKGAGLEDERETAMELALACGGPAVSSFINVLLNDPSLEPELRANLLDELSGTHGGLFSIRRLPVNEALGSTAMTLCRSSKPEDRYGGAGLLGGVETEASRNELRRLIAEDGDLGVRTSAILSLGHVGDQPSREFLERLWTAPETSKVSGQGAAKYRSAIESALEKLGKR